MRKIPQHVHHSSNRKTPNTHGQRFSEALHWASLEYLQNTVTYYIHLLDFYRKQEMEIYEAYVLALLNCGYDPLGDVDEAIDPCAYSLAIARKIEERDIVSRALIAISIAYVHLGYAKQVLAEWWGRDIFLPNIPVKECCIQFALIFSPLGTIGFLSLTTRFVTRELVCLERGKTGVVLIILFRSMVLQGLIAVQHGVDVRLIDLIILQQTHSPREPLPVLQTAVSLASASF